jgi:sulfite exporter TauE/SafE
MSSIPEALILGFGSGPVCVAACGPVLFPWLAAEPQGLRRTGRMLAIFLSGRLGGYIGFAVIAWAAGLAIPLGARPRGLVFGFANLALAAFLGISAFLLRKHCQPEERDSGERLYQIEPRSRSRMPAALTLGFLTGLNLCPPFIAAGVRAAETHSLSGSLVFFSLFFVGTAVWFLPALAVSPLRRFRAAPLIARFTMAALAVYYTYLGIIAIAAWGPRATATLLTTVRSFLV